MSDIESRIKEIIVDNLLNYDLWVFLFGSRAMGINNDRADFDVGIFSPQGPLPLLNILNIKEKLDLSDIPYLVDVVDFSVVDDNFRKIAGRKVIIWKKMKNQSPPEWMHLVEP